MTMLETPKIELFNEKKEQLIKVFDFERGHTVYYIINSILNIVNRWDKIRIYVYDINIKGEGVKNE